MLSLIILFTYIYLQCIQSQLSCLGPENKPINWWFIYKTPKTACGENTFLYYDQYHQDSFSVSGEDRLQRKDFFSDDQYDPTALELTMNQIWFDYIKEDSKREIAWIDYNDQPAGEKNPPTNTWGHTKGVIAYTPSNQSGFWIIHSQPSWPNFSKRTLNEHAWPAWPADASNVKSQQFLCISFAGLDYFNDIIKQLRIISAYAVDGIYLDAVNNTDFIPLLNNVEYDAIPNRDPPNSPDFELKTPETLQPEQKDFFYFRTEQKAGYSLYARIDKYYEESFVWDSWLVFLTKVSEKSFEPYIAYLVTTTQPEGCKEWHRSDTHCKIGVTKQKNIVCAGDVNIYQIDRGGGMMCFVDQQLTDLLLEIYKVYKPMSEVVKDSIDTKTKEKDEIDQLMKDDKGKEKVEKDEIMQGMDDDEYVEIKKELKKCTEMKKNSKKIEQILKVKPTDKKKKISKSKKKNRERINLLNKQTTKLNNYLKK